MLVSGNKILISAIASKSIAEGQALYISGPGQVAPGYSSVASKVAGVADSAASAGESVNVIVLGLASVIADGPVSAGDRVILASTAGRVISENSVAASVSDPGHTHTQADLGITAVASLDNDLGQDGAGGLETTGSGTSITTPDTDSATTGISASVEQGRVLGKAWGSASAAGESLLVFVHV